jgi:secondary thiamine-phosphate synthase enzyme
MITLKFNTKYKSQMIDISKEIKEAIIKSGVKSGIVTVFCPHSTANVVIFEKSDPSLRRELLSMLKDMIPYKDYTHYNARAHLKAALLRTNVTLIIENADIVLGEWQSIFLVEFDGPRERKIHLKVISD